MTIDRGPRVARHRPLAINLLVTVRTIEFGRRLGIWVHPLVVWRVFSRVFAQSKRDRLASALFRASDVMAWLPGNDTCGLASSFRQTEPARAIRFRARRR